MAYGLDDPTQLKKKVAPPPGEVPQDGTPEGDALPQTAPSLASVGTMAPSTADAFAGAAPMTPASTSPGLGAPTTGNPAPGAGAPGGPGLAPPAPSLNLTPGGTSQMTVQPPPPPPMAPEAPAAVNPFLSTNNDSPLAGMTEAQKAAFWASKFQGAGQLGVVGGGTTGIRNDPTTGKVDPNAAIAGQTALANDPATVGIVAQANAKASAQEAARNASSDAYNLDTIGKDEDAQIAGIKAVGGAFTPAEEAAKRALMQANSGYDAAGKFIGEPANNPNATNGMPAGYDPTKAKEVNGGSTDATGYHAPDTTKPGEFIINGQVYDNPKGEGTPLRAAPGTPSNTSTGTATTGTGTGAPPSMTKFDETTNLRDSQINPGATDRGAIAQKYLDAFDTRAAPQLRDKLRSVGQRAASLGRIGMGDTAVEAMTPYTDMMNERNALETTLAGQSAAGQIGDEANARGEYRTERDYQQAMARQAIQDAMNQWQMGEQSKNSEFGRNATAAGMMMGAGQTSGANAGMDWNAIASLLAPYLNATKK